MWENQASWDFAWWFTINCLAKDPLTDLSSSQACLRTLADIQCSVLFCFLLFVSSPLCGRCSFPLTFLGYYPRKIWSHQHFGWATKSLRCDHIQPPSTTNSGAQTQFSATQNCDFLCPLGVRRISSDVSSKNFITAGIIALKISRHAR